MLKELFYSGLGAAASVKEKVEEELKKLEEKGKLNKDDAKNFMASIEQKGKEEEDRIKEQIKSSLKEVISELGLATKEDLEKLKQELKA